MTPCVYLGCAERGTGSYNRVSAANRAHAYMSCIQSSDVSRLTVMSRQLEDESIQILYEISQLMNAGLSRETIAICKQLCALGVHPETLAVRCEEHIQQIMS